MSKIVNIASVEWPGRDGLSIGTIIGYVQFKNIPARKTVEVDINLAGLKPNSPHAIHIHEEVDDLGRGGRWLYKRGFVTYGSMTPQEIEMVSGQKYSKKVVGDLIINTTTTGNAGGRMACGNIVMNS